MPTGLIVMILLGCADGSDQCDRVGVAPATYATVAQCVEAMPNVLPTQSSYAYPTIAAQCEPAPRTEIAAR
ncbi:hypothetical protein GCM10011529_26580 [Polymorphobacter glacialis]|uniref:Uncharacterized protein n=1 Tax=Sandarakinorhabdus glacialis TaxID=1614636 RepID=A0A916ZY28_9SPHN|nr:hypothetical protein [Polymorphobacter glacialis]GGE18801.1 hypothetical protein GCM10011529_26580 [Polymorphobacter glacialis]